MRLFAQIYWFCFCSSMYCLEFSRPLSIGNFPQFFNDDNTGTVFIGCEPTSGSKTGNYIFKIGAKYYTTGIHRINQKTVNLRCKYFKLKSVNCKFTATLSILLEHNPKSPSFTNRNNFVIKSVSGNHSCQGFKSEIDARFRHGSPKHFSNPNLLRIQRFES